ncbi:hypothetical protein GCM10017566_49190 [Amycolatopsis bartoniae]|uniref:AMP-dependent synthetase/ligase domain-containing protein n=1 Tax=Amycolatopsis bartoniae TaxID=941986 RepID=A0A8H9IV82_9PSEU|nr:hypothetical protein GCM10017566_49190 [Amycolatopsis bartoniae]
MTAVQDPHRQPRTLTELLAGLSASERRVVFPDDDDAVLPHRDLPGLACAVAELLRGNGVRDGDVVGMLVPTGPRWLPAYFGAVVAGAAASALPLPPIVLDPAQVAEHLKAIVDAGRIGHVVAAGLGRKVAAELAKVCPGLVVLDVTDLPPAPRVRIPDVDPDSLAVVQFSSGSTSRPKGVMLSHRAVLAGVSAINSHIETTGEDVLVQWVPLFHDMGVVALLCSLLTPNDAHLFSPLSFIRRPARVLTRIAEARGTIVTGPNFSYDKYVSAAADAFGDQPDGAPLKTWRLALNGAEQVRAHTVETFQRTFVPLGAAPSTMYPCYGMAEATLAVTLPVLGSEPRILAVDRDSTHVGRAVELVGADSPRSRLLTSVGVPVPGMAVRVTDDAGTPLPPGVLGEVCIQGPAVTSGYLHNPEHTARTLREGWLRTGDLGFFDDGELFIAGRVKEMIVVQGRNFFPDDVEERARRVAGVHKGRCVAIADPVAEGIVVVAESELPAGEHEALSRRIRGAVSGALGLSAVQVLVVLPRMLPRTTSGKWQRALVQQTVKEHSHG